MRLRPILLAGLGCLALAGCHKKGPPANSLDAMDNALVNAAGNNLAADITVDRNKTGGLTVGELAKRQADERAPNARTIISPLAGDCGGTLTYSDRWAHELPADLPLPPGAKLTEAAGKNGGCQVRVVSFTVPVGRQAVIDWWKQRAESAGYSTGRADKGGDMVLAGYRARDGSSFDLMVGHAQDNRTPVDLVYTH